MGDPFDGLLRRVEESALHEADKAAISVSLLYLKQSALAAVSINDPRLREIAIRNAQKLLGVAGKAMQAVEP